jgi:hypothetical protein
MFSFYLEFAPVYLVLHWILVCEKLYKKKNKHSFRVESAGIIWLLLTDSALIIN